MQPSYKRDLIREWPIVQGSSRGDAQNDSTAIRAVLYARELHRLLCDCDSVTLVCNQSCLQVLARALKNELICDKLENNLLLEVMWSD